MHRQLDWPVGSTLVDGASVAYIDVHDKKTCISCIDLTYFKEFLCSSQHRDPTPWSGVHAYPFAAEGAMIDKLAGLRNQQSNSTHFEF